jgi:SAM-dependent methyltransferase
VTALKPARQGAVFWPAEDKGLVCMCDEGALPVESNSVDRILVVHACQDFDGMDAILSESWRVLTGQGRLVLVVPNRSGIWARFDNTPFGHGAPWSLGQLRHLLKEYMFVPENAERALFFPPASSRLMLAAAPVWEKAGQKFFNAFGGVNIVEASKQLYAGIPATEPAAARKRRFPATALPVPERHRF